MSVVVVVLFFFFFCFVGDITFRDTAASTRPQVNSAPGQLGLLNLAWLHYSFYVKALHLRQDFFSHVETKPSFESCI